MNMHLPNLLPIAGPLKEPMMMINARILRKRRLMRLHTLIQLNRSDNIPQRLFRTTSPIPPILPPLGHVRMHRHVHDEAPERRARVRHVVDLSNEVDGEDARRGGELDDGVDDDVFEVVVL